MVRKEIKTLFNDIWKIAKNIEYGNLSRKNRKEIASELISIHDNLVEEFLKLEENQCP